MANPSTEPLSFAHPCTRDWFDAVFEGPTEAQTLGWPAIASGDSTLLLAPTGSGKTLAAFLVAIDRLAFREAVPVEGVKVLYISPLKALGVDVERNLRSPLIGINAVAQREGATIHPIRVGVRTGDTPQSERQRMVRKPPDILITTPESLYLMLTSRARKILASVDTVIVDEIHSVVPTKRGAHLALSLERLESLRSSASKLQRIGLSATQRPLDEVARFLGGSEIVESRPKLRPVTIIDAGHRKNYEIKVEVPVEDMARLDEPAEAVPDLEFGEDGPRRPVSIWPAIHPRLIALIRAHRSTMIFVNSRRLAERLAEAINELAEEELVLAHHGSVAKDLRASIEDRLKRGELPAIIATSSLELGIDIGSVDLVIQIEAPLSVASGIQRIGRAGHQVGATSRGIVFPKFRGDLLACAAATGHVAEGRVEATYYPRNALDVLAQQLVAQVVAAEGEVPVDELYDWVRQAANYQELPRRSFDGVLDMLSGRYPSEEFGELRPRLTWDRITGTIAPRRGARMLAIANAGTIPDRGLYGVFLAGAEKPVRVGELDEEMVFESREGEIFILGASSWRIEEITHDRVLVSPAPGVAGKMPFWRGDRPGRPAEFGRAIGELSRQLTHEKPKQAQARLTEHHGLDEKAADNLLRYLADQLEATGQLPTDRTVVIERFVDEIGDLVVVLLTPFGARVHAPWATAVQAELIGERSIDPDVIWGDDGIVFRLPECDSPPPDDVFFPDPDEVERRVTGRLGETALFASHFRENAARALLLPRRRPGQRTPLWAQRRKSAHLLNVASNFRDFPILLETYRECLQDVFDLPALIAILSEVKSRKIRVTSVETRQPSPFAAALLFNYVSNFMYDGDAPMAERRAQALTLDHAQLRELLGEPELRELLDADAVEEVAAELQRTAYPLRHADGIHDLLLVLGDLSNDDLLARSAATEWLEELQQRRRIVTVNIGGEARWIAAEDCGRYRDGLGIVPPQGVPVAFLEPVEHALEMLLSRYARTRPPFRAEDTAAHFGLGLSPVRAALGRLVERGKLVEGEFLPATLLARRGWRGGREYVDPDVLRRMKRRSLAKLRKQAEAVPQAAFARFSLDWHGLNQPRRGIDGLAATIMQLQGAAIPASVLESSILPARVREFDRRDLDELCASGEILWRGVHSLGPKDGRVALYHADHFALLAEPRPLAEGELGGELRELLQNRGALFFRDMVGETNRAPTEVHAALWDLVWAGEVTNDTLAPLRGLRAESRRNGANRAGRSGNGLFGGRRSGTNRLGRGSGGGAAPPGSEGRWSLLPTVNVTPTERLKAVTTQLLERHGVLTREAIRTEGMQGGFTPIYGVLKAMEEAGRVRRGYFVAGLGATQFVLPGCEDRLRAQRELKEDHDQLVILAATDPANPYGAALPWPACEARGGRAQRAAGAQVILHRGRLVGFLGKTGKKLLTFLPEDEPERAIAAEALAAAVARGWGRARGRRGSGGVLITQVDGESAPASAFRSHLETAGFRVAGQGMFRRVG